MKKALSVLLVLCLLVLGVAACGKTNEPAAEAKTITVAASTTPHAEILEQCKAAMTEKGFDLVIKKMDDYIIPNTSTENGEVDANYFQHTPYLEQFNAEQNTHLVSVAKIHYEPYAIYAGTAKALADLADGAKIAVPNDATNEARALMLLDAAGLIKLDDATNLTATKQNIVENPHNFEIVEMEAALLPGVLGEVAVAVINGNYALSAGLDVKTALATEDASSAAAQTYGNILVVKEGNENNDAVKALVEVLTSKEIAQFISDTYNGAVLPLN